MSFSSFTRAPILRSRSHTGLLPITSAGSGSLSRFDSHRGSFGKRRGASSAWRVVSVVAMLAVLGSGGYAAVRYGALGSFGSGISSPKRGMREEQKPAGHALHGHLETDPNAQQRDRLWAEHHLDDAHLHAHLERGKASIHPDAHAEADAEPHLLGHHLEHAVHQEAGLHVAAGSQQQEQQHVDGGAVTHDAHQQKQQQQKQQHEGPPSLYDAGIDAVDIHGNVVHLSDLRGKATIIVNVASKCGYTESNYKGLQGVYDRYHEHGLEILAFPCNQFGAQEPGSHQEIYDFATTKYQASFPLMAKVDVNGPAQHPAYKWLKVHAPAAPGGHQGEDIAWNFEKFLIDKWGVAVKRYPSDLVYKGIELDIYNELIRQYP